MENWSYTSNPLKPCLSLRNRSSTESHELFHFETNGLFKARSYSCLSDSKSRKNIKDLDDSITIDKLKPKSYYNSLTKSNEIGFEADELKKEFPDLVDDCSYSSVSINYNGLIPVLVKEVKNLKSRINELEGISTPSSIKSADLSYDNIFQPIEIPIGPTGPTSIFFTKPASFRNVGSTSSSVTL